MPQIPEIISSQAYQTTPEPFQNPDALSRSSDILAAGMKDVSGSLASMLARIAASQQQADAAGLEAGNSVALTDLRNKYANDPDPATVPQRFKAEAEQWSQGVLGGIADPNTRFYVSKNLSHRIPVAYAEISGEALRQQHAAAVGTIGQAASTQAQQLAGAANAADETLALTGLKSAIAGAVAAGTIDAPTGNKLFSGSVRQAATLRGARDPAGAQALVDRLAPEMQASDVAELAVHLRPQIERQQEDSAAAATITAGSATAAGAQAVRAGFIARGYDPDFATAMAANAVRESSAGQRQVNDDGSSRGYFQLTGSRLAAFRKQYGIDPNKATLDQQLDFADQELKGSEAPALAAINAAVGSGAKAAAVSRAFLRPGLTPEAQDAAANKSTAIAERLTTFGGQTDLPSMVADVQQRTAGLPLHVQQAATARVIESYHQQEAGLAPARAELTREISDLITAYEAGVTDPPIPSAKINALLPPADQARVTEQLTIARNAGKLFSAVQLASPADEQAARAALAVPGSLSSQTPRRDGKIIGTAPADGDGPTPPESPDAARIRLAVAAKYEQLLTQKHEAIARDPAGYAAATSPALGQLAQAADLTKPETLAPYLDASQQAQAQLGVTPENRRTLTNGQVAGVMASLLQGDPAKNDIGAQIDALRKTYGDHWQGAFGDLVKIGKLSPDWQVVAAMTEPAQIAPRVELVRALQAAAAPGGREKLAAAVPPDDKKVIDKNLAGDLAPFRATIMAPGEALNLPLYTAVQEAVRTLAYANAMKTPGGEDALKSAVQSIIGEKYDIGGTLRAPKGQLAKAEAMGTEIQSGLTPADVKPPAYGGNPDLTPAENAATIATAARRSGQWMTNEKDDGAVLTVTLRNGSRVLVIKPDGTPIGYKWADLAGRTAPAASTGAVDDYGSPVPPAPAMPAASAQAVTEPTITLPTIAHRGGQDTPPTAGDPIDTRSPARRRRDQQ